MSGWRPTWKRSSRATASRRGAAPAPHPIPEAFENKPRQLPDLASAVGLLDKIGGMVERIQKREGERSISLADMDRVLSELGFKAELALKEVIPDDAVLQTFEPAALRRELGRALTRHWATVRY
ncbi:hypothetical protein [Deinococcus apachensis]|uniref:hypothetical protein n=1 Tax=Deinococcus apachensis TaxID=309886 RepID=UPI00036FC6FA|nr:hypothetical protein [Deinococcus apachensis]